MNIELLLEVVLNMFIVGGTAYLYAWKAVQVASVACHYVVRTLASSARWAWS